MEIIFKKNQPSLNSIQGGKKTPETLPLYERELIDHIAEAFNIIYGGQFKKRRQSA